MKRYMPVSRALKSPRLDVTLLRDRLITRYFDDRGGDVDYFLPRGTKVQYLTSVPLLDESGEYYLAVVLLPNGRRTIINHSMLTDPEPAQQVGSEGYRSGHGDSRGHSLPFKI